MKIRPTRWNATIYGAILLPSTIALIFIIAIGAIELKDVATGLLALLGTFVGAFLAFRLQGYGEEIKETGRRKSALNRAILVLGAQENEIRSYAQHLSKYSTKLDRALNMPAAQPPETIDLRQRLDDLSFLTETGHPQIIFDLFIEQIRFDQAMQMIRTRNSFYVNEVQHKLAETLPNGTIATEDKVSALLGGRLYLGAITGAEEVYRHIDESSKSIPDAIRKVRHVSKELYPNDKFLNFEPVPFETDKTNPV